MLLHFFQLERIDDTYPNIGPLASHYSRPLVAVLHVPSKEFLNGKKLPSTPPPPLVHEIQRLTLCCARKWKNSRSVNKNLAFFIQFFHWINIIGIEGMCWIFSYSCTILSPLVDKIELGNARNSYFTILLSVQETVVLPVEYAFCLCTKRKVNSYCPWCGQVIQLPSRPRIGPFG
jgi:hypothetical protein